MPASTVRSLGVSGMGKCSRIITKLVKFWRDEQGSKLTSHWAESLLAYVKELLALPKFMDQMYQHVAELLFTMDTAPDQAYIAFSHLANMGSMTSSLQRMYGWNEKAIELVQTRMNVRPRQVRFKSFGPFLNAQNDQETTAFFKRIMGAGLKNTTPTTMTSTTTSTSNQEPLMALSSLGTTYPTEISEDDHMCIVEAADLLDMENNLDKHFNLGTNVADDSTIYANRAEAEDIMSVMSYETSRSSRLLSDLQDRNEIDLNLSQLDLSNEDKLVLPIEAGEDGKAQIQALISDVNVSYCNHWDHLNQVKCEQEALVGQYWCAEHQGLHFDRSNEFLKELKGFSEELTFHLTKSIKVENHDDILIMMTFEYATSYNGPTDAFLHGKKSAEKLLKACYDIFLKNPSDEFSKFNHETLRSLFPEVQYSLITWYHVYMSAKTLMKQIKHPLYTPWVQTIPFLCFKLGGAQGFVNPTKALNKVEWHNELYPTRNTKIADDILQPNAMRQQGKIWQIRDFKVTSFSLHFLSNTFVFTCQILNRSGFYSSVESGQ